MAEGQLTLPVLPGPALVVGPVFIAFEYAAGVPDGRVRDTPIVAFKQRHRYRIVYPKNGKAFVSEYPAPESEGWEKAIGQIAALHMRGRPPSVRPFSLLVHVFKPVPESWTKREKEAALAGAIRPTSSPDGDNHLKVVQDALNKIVWVDDSQVVDARVIKVYSAKPALRIEAREFVDPVP